MVAFILRRFASMLVVLFCVITITFLLVRIAPGGPFTKERKIPPAIEKQILARYNLDGTLWEQFTTYLGVRKNVEGKFSGLLQGDLSFPQVPRPSRANPRAACPSRPRSASRRFSSRRPAASGSAASRR